MASTGIIVIGGGAAGMMAAGRAAESGAEVLLLEKMPETGNKLRLTGNERGNLSNSKPLAEFIAMYGTNGRFLYTAFNRFFREDLTAWLAGYGLKTKVTADGRIFPVSDDAGDIYRALHRYLDKGKVRIITGQKVTGILAKSGEVTGVRTAEEEYQGRAVILAAGGASYPGTGSSGDGYQMAAALGHTIKDIRPASVPLATEDAGIVKELQGISLHDIRLTAYACKADEIDTTRFIKTDYGRGTSGKKPRPPVTASRRGDLLFTHFGISGPVTLAVSLAVVDALAKGPVSVAIDLKPEREAGELKREMQQEMERYGKRQFRNTLRKWLPEKMAGVLLELSNIPEDKLNHQVTAEERLKAIALLKAFKLDIKSALPIAAAMVTAGGVDLDEIEPGTMASKLIKGLYFCGEVIDVDAETGGYNLQAAFSTGWVAGEGAAKYETQSSKL